jgi:hypothetical protein
MNKKIKNLKGRVNSDYIKVQYVIPYSLENNSRYKHRDELLLRDGKVIKATSGPIDMGIIPYDGITLYTVTEAEENRIDIIATKFYGSASMYWVICMANNISDPLDLPIGRILSLPSASALRRFPNQLS